MPEQDEAERAWDVWLEAHRRELDPGVWRRVNEESHGGFLDGYRAAEGPLRQRIAAVQAVLDDMDAQYVTRCWDCGALRRLGCYPECAAPRLRAALSEPVSAPPAGGTQ